MAPEKNLRGWAVAALLAPVAIFAAACGTTGNSSGTSGSGANATPVANAKPISTSHGHTTKVSATKHATKPAASSKLAAAAAKALGCPAASELAGVVFKNGQPQLVAFAAHPGQKVVSATALGLYALTTPNQQWALYAPAGSSATAYSVSLNGSAQLVGDKFSLPQLSAQFITTDPNAASGDIIGTKVFLMCVPADPPTNPHCAAAGQAVVSITIIPAQGDLPLNVGVTFYGPFSHGVVGHVEEKATPFFPENGVDLMGKNPAGGYTVDLAKDPAYTHITGTYENGRPYPNPVLTILPGIWNLYPGDQISFCSTAP